MSLSLKKDISERVIDPREFIAEAHQEAKQAVSLLEEKQAVDETSVFEFKDDDSLDKKATDLIAAMDEYLENPPEGSKLAEKQATDKKEKPAEKSAVAKIIGAGIEDDALQVELEKAADKVEDRREPVSIDISA